MSRDDSLLAESTLSGTAEDIEAVRVFDAYLAEIQAGRSADPERLVAEHPAISDQLRAFLNIAHLVDRVATNSLPKLEDYRIIREIGRGGMGIVYEAEQISRGCRVALKVLTSAAALDPRQLRRFQVEVQAAQLLRHHHIVPIALFGCERGVYYYAMQFIEGQDLATLIAGFREAGEDKLTSRVDPKETPPGVGSVDFDVPAVEHLPVTLDGIDGLASTRDRGYFRKVARWAMQAAEALDHAHDQGVLHRDIKPSNLLIDVRGNLWVTDFGLAQVRGEAGVTRTGDLLGTLRYMSPEQALAQRVVIDGRTDIYSLGVTLYESLTLHPAFEGRDRQDLLRRIAQEEPQPPRHLAPVPWDLETIVLKAMAKEREYRYATAQELADDLRHFLVGEPIRARRPSLMDRAAKWARRHQAATVAAFTTLAVAVMVLSVSTVMIAREQKRAVAAKRETQRESLIQQILQILSTAHASGWSDVTEELVHRAARLGPEEDGRLQGYAAASHGGLDTRLIKKIPIETATLGFEPSGKRLYLCDTNGQAWVWDGSANPIQKIGMTGVGVFGFKPDGMAVQLLSATEEKPGEIELRALELAKTLRRFRSPIGPGSRIVAISLTPDAALVAATILTKEDGGFAVVWNGETGDIVRQVEISRPTALKLAPDGRWLAVGTNDGGVSVWPLPEGDPLPQLAIGRVAVTTLAFAPDRLRRAQTKRQGDAWLLAAGDAATALAIFDLGTGSVRSRCLGSNYELRTVNFSPDGMLLASAGRSTPTLWNVSTGRAILQVARVNTATAIAFSPDGKRIAVSSQNAFGDSGRVEIYELENGRGLQTLWGLDAQVEKAIFSSDNRFVAALAQDFQVGIWDRVSGQLLHILDVPIGKYTDNAGLAFSDDSRRFAFAAGTKARMWDVETGEILKSWELPEGFQDNLSFLGPDHLISARVETADPRVPPYDTDPERFPRLLHIRNLNADVPQLVARLSDFNLKVFHSELTRDGRWLLIEGLSGPRQAPERLVKAFDIAGHRELWTIRGTHPEFNAASFHFDPTGRVYMRQDPGPENRVDLLEFPSRAVLDTYGKDDDRKGVSSLGPGGQLFLSSVDWDENPPRIRLWAPRRDTPLLTVANSATRASSNQFSLDGRFAVWGNSDGTVVVLEFEQLQRRLTKFRLGW